jgi:hypothetical protein
MPRTAKDHLGTFFFCDLCPTSVVYEVSHTKGYKQHYFQVNKELSGYRLHLYPSGKEPFQVYKFYEEHSLLIKLPYLPKINPTNAKQWLDKLLKLKAFF